VLDVLSACTETPDRIGVTELATRVGLSKTVVFRILRTLVSRGFLSYVEDGRHYRLGPAAFQLGARMLAGADLRSVALPVMRELRDRTGESVALAVLLDDANTYIDQVPSTDEVRMTVEIGRAFPLNAGAQGKVTLAFASPQVRTRVLGRPLDRMTGNTVVDRSALERELDEIRLAGTAISRGERLDGAAAVAAPILGADGYAAGSIAIYGPAARFDRDSVPRFRALVSEGAMRISEVYRSTLRQAV
jgi:DNA-binding IclR family transcriptional regulator